jgi:tRNA threonylcarbamoyladenosine biosynthesis protein TsaB
VAEPLVLGLDTATTVAVGLARGPEVLAVAGLADRMAHVEQLVPLVQQCLQQAGLRAPALDQVVVGLGPGPFTGLRVGIATAQVLATALGIGWHGVCSLDVLAAQHVTGRGDVPDGSGEFVVATDARRREVYWARYDRAGVRLDGPRVSAPADVPPLPTVGPAAEVYPDQLVGVPGPRSLDAGLLAAHGLALPDAGREPLYLRRPDASEPSRPKSVLLPRSPR